MILTRFKKQICASIVILIISILVFFPGNIPASASSNTPSIIATTIVDNSISFKVNYPQNATTRLLQLYNTSTNTWQQISNTQNGTYTFNNLTANTLYKGVLSWYDGRSWRDVYKEVKTFPNTSSQQGSIANYNTTTDSISFHIAFPQDATNRTLRIRRGTTTVNTISFTSTARANGVFTFSNLQPDVQYTGVISWTQSGTTKTLSMNVRTLLNAKAEDGYPSITCTAVTTNSIEVNYVYPNSSAYGNRLQLYNYSTGQFIQASPDFYMTNGTYKFWNLTNNTKYRVYISWHDGSKWNDLGLDVMTGSKVYRTVVLNIDPVMKDNNNNFMRVSQKWNWWWPDYRDTLNKFKTYVSEASGGRVNFNIVTIKELNDFPEPNNTNYSYHVSRDGYYDNVKNYPNLQYDMFNIYDAQGNRGVNYSKLIANLGLANYISHNQIDFVFPFSVPATGFYEQIMAGPTSWVVNSATPLTQAQCPVNRNVLFLAHGMDRDAGLFLHVLGHYVETTMNGKVSVNWPKVHSVQVTNPTTNLSYQTTLNDWQYFSLSDFDNYGVQWNSNTYYAAPGNSQVGTVHFPPNGGNYEYNSSLTVQSGAHNWHNYPNLTTSKMPVNASTWKNKYDGNNPEESFMRWWFDHIPKNNGSRQVNGVTINNNWWPYFMNIN